MNIQTLSNLYGDRRRDLIDALNLVAYLATLKAPDTVVDQILEIHQDQGMEAAWKAIDRFAP